MITKLVKSKFELRNSKLLKIISSIWRLFGGFMIWLSMYFLSFIISNLTSEKQEIIFCILCIILFAIVSFKTSTNLLDKISNPNDYSEESSMPIVMLILLLLITGILSVILNMYFFTIWYVVSCIALSITFFLKAETKKTK